MSAVAQWGEVTGPQTTSILWDQVRLFHPVATTQLQLTCLISGDVLFLHLTL